MWSLLVVITLPKCTKWTDAFRTRKRALHLELRGAHDTTEFESAHAIELLSREPGPYEAAALTDLVEQLVSSFDRRHREIVMLRMQGFSLDEIAERVRSSRRTVARVIAAAKSAALSLM